MLKRNRDQLYYCKASTKSAAIFLFLLTHTKHDRGILNVAFLREETLSSRSFSAKQLSRALIQAVSLWPHFANTAGSPDPVMKGYSTFWKVTAHFMPCMNSEQQRASPDSSSFYSRELAHQPQPQKACKVINLHTYSWESHSYGFITWKQNSVLVCLWLHR